MKNQRDTGHMLVLKYLETNFDKQTSKVKLELILFPLVIFFLLIVIFNYVNNPKTLDKSVSSTISLKKLSMKKKVLDILNDLEFFIKENNIQLNKISNTKKSINIEIKSSLINQIKFIKFVEDYSNFAKIKYLKNEGEVLILDIVFDKFYIKNSFDLNTKLINIKNKKTKDLDLNLSLFAIVDNKALINDKWLKIEDFIYTYKIIEININSVILMNSLKTIELMINKNENN